MKKTNKSYDLHEEKKCKLIAVYLRKLFDPLLKLIIFFSISAVIIIFYSLTYL